MQSLSSRGQALINAPLRDDFELFHEAEQNPFHAIDNPDGAITLCIAENVLSWTEMKAKLSEVSKRDIPSWVAKYTDIKGAPESREALAGFAERHISTLGGQTAIALSPENFCISSGATGAIELTSMLLGDDGDVAAFPAPCYPVYKQDVGHKAHLQRYDIQCAAGWSSAGGNHPLNLADVQRSAAEIKASGKQLRMLVLTQPDNPTGAIYTQDQLTELADWCITNQVHLCVNELYALSQINMQQHELAADYSDPPTSYTSFLHLLEKRRSPYLHWWYSFSKDFGISGLRCGVMYTRNTDLLQAFSNFGAPHTVSNYTQWMLANLLQDEQWVAAFAKTNQARLTNAYQQVIMLLQDCNITYTAARGSLFVWARLNTKGQLSDEEFWRKLYTETGVLLTSPGGFGQAEKGWLRIVYSCVEPAALSEALRRMKVMLLE